MRQRGFSYIGLLLALAILGVLLGNTALMWHTQAKHERELELLFIGDQFAAALDSYQSLTPNGTREFPPSLEALLEDRRFPMPVHHLRKLYVDPITRDRDWGLIRQDGRIVAVHSRSSERPLKQAGFEAGYEDLRGAASYADWLFKPHPASPPGARR
jgi:type II secretory pathway pseudopilin PulG